MTTTSEQIKDALTELLIDGDLIGIDKWQATNVHTNMYEITNLFLKMPIGKTVEEIANQTSAQLPWSEDHFKERISGKATNPGEQYKNWPFYHHGKDDARFRAEGKFSHTYQERFWPPVKEGIRYSMGNLNDVIERLKQDPKTRQAFFAIWHPEDQSNHGNRLPCTIGYHFLIRNGKLNITYLIRSCDAIRHFRNDIYMTQRLAMHVAENAGDYELGEMSMWIGSFHCFESDVYTIKKQLKDVWI